jgi:serine/threonine protein kinase
MNLVAAGHTGRKVEDLIGMTVDQKYEIKSVLGVGGMGTVYLSTRLLIGDTVAIKVLNSDQVADAQSVERFRREAQAAARLKHPNAVSIYDFGVSESGLVYLVMEMVEGQSLGSIIKQQGPLTPTAAAEILSQVCAALDEAHRQGIIHRDLKPDNIIVSYTNDGLRVKVLDFGVAKIRDLSATAANLTQAGTVMGTPHYMSPEQCLGEELDGRSDIYSLGVVLYEVLAGMVPFNSPASTAVVVQHVTQPPPPLRIINASISLPVEAVVLRALAKQREARPQTAGTLSQEMTAAVFGGAITQPNAAGSPTTNPLAPMTTPSAVSAGMAPTMQIKTPTWSGALTPASIQPTESGATQQVKARNRLAPFILGAVILMAVAAGVVAWLAWSGEKKSEDTNKTQANDGKGTTKATGTPIPPPGMAYVAGSEFLMGNDDGDEYERPAHKVMVKDFFIDIYEVTCEDYEKFIRATGHQPPESWVDGRYPPGSARRPVTGVSWDDAFAYAKWVGKRLPSEAEWEFAARGDDGRRYPWGNDWKASFANADVSAIGHMADVGNYPAGKSACGAFDMVGNAWEWTASDLIAYPGAHLSVQLSGDLKVLRGGCWMSKMNEATTTYRNGWPARGARTYDTTSFRCVKDAIIPSGS